MPSLHEALQAPAQTPPRGSMESNHREPIEPRKELRYAFTELRWITLQTAPRHYPF